VSSFITDTHALLWYLSDDPALSPLARGIFQQADRGQADLVVPSISLVEVVYLAERQRVPSEIIDRILALPTTAGSHYSVAPLDIHIIQAVRLVPRDLVPDMPDRIIAATALHHNLPLLTRDRRISQLTNIQCRW
jgi:PIN domain nuclease of toxin-antitoxin system